MSCNICRSPMAEAIFNCLVKERGISKEFCAFSAAVSREGIPFEKRGAVQLRREDYALYDYLIGMEEYNLRGMLRILGGDPEGKVYRLMDFTSIPQDVDDPWYTGDFDRAFRDIREGCEGLLQHLLEKGAE